MIVTFTIGNLPGENPAEMWIQDSRFADYDMVYWLVNYQPAGDFTQDKATRRVTRGQVFNSGDFIICHLRK